MRRARGTPPLHVLSRQLITRHATGRSFADVGAMWNVHGAYAFHALDAGAESVIALDLMPATPEFTAANAARGGRVRFVQGDINLPEVIERVGQVEVTFCSGVLYHVPDPIWTLRQLRRLTQSILILASATIPEQRHPQAAVFLPFLAEEARRRLTYRTVNRKIGLDSAFVPEAHYANWFWALTPSCVIAMARAAGLEPVETYSYRHTILLLCAPS